MKLRPIIIFAALCLCTSSVTAQPAYKLDKMQRERLGRGVVAVRENKSDVVVTWRYLSSDPMSEAFDVYRDGVKINVRPVTDATFFKDKYSGSDAATYTVKPVNGTLSGTYTLPASAPVGYVCIPLDKPADRSTPAGATYSYSPNDASVGDVDGDGEYEIILKWEPSNAHDNSHDGYTGNVLLDCYTLSGKKLWRIDLGRNIRAGAHYTQFMVYDLDGDGRAEVVMRTADGTVDGRGKVIGDASADYREHGQTSDNDSTITGMTPKNQGRILSGPEYLTVFSGLTGEAMATIDYVPQRGDPMSWGDKRANRSDRFLACVAYLDGVRPSVVMCRGYYTRSVLVAFDWDGSKLMRRWVFDTDRQGNGKFAGQGDHSLRVGDVDGDGRDEIIYGAMAVDHDGTGIYSTGLGHGDALHLTQFTKDLKRLQVWSCHENKRDGSVLRDAATGEIIFQIKSNTDVGRCMAADINPESKGLEMWSLRSGGLRSFSGKAVSVIPRGMSYNFGVWWDGDLLRELLDKNYVQKYDWRDNTVKKIKVFEGCVANNSSKQTPCLCADILGDWREEVLLRSEDNASLRLYVSTEETGYRFHTFMQDPIYRISVATQNVGYNQPTQPGFYFGPDLKGETFRGTKIQK